MTLPTIHLNGTSRAALVDAHYAALVGVQHAIEALADAAPNARDYYVQGPDAYPAARREHEARMHKLADVAHELSALLEALEG